MNFNMNIFCLAAVLTVSSTLVCADSDVLLQAQHAWAQCQYKVAAKDNKQACFNQNIDDLDGALGNAPENAELMVWLAINKASLAGVKGGFGALSLVKQSKKLLEQVIDTAPNTLAGSAYTSLGSLYYQVPGRPLGFGSDDKAEAMLKKALEINPNGIDPNYFYGDFLAHNGRKSEAYQYLIRAQNAAPRQDRPVADQGRQQEITALLESIK